MQREYKVRRATVDDTDAIAHLTYVQKAKSFGNKRSKYGDNDSLFNSYQTLRLVVETNKLVGDGNGSVEGVEMEVENIVVAYAELRNYPAIGSLPSDSWLEWLHERYCINYPISWVNTLFFTYVVYAEAHPNTLLHIQREAFYIENRIMYLIAVKMPELDDISSYYSENFEDMEKYAKIFYPREFSIQTNSDTQSLYIVHRYSLLSKINYRKALAEDNDDIVEIHECEFPEMRAELGDFYIAEELMRHDKEAKNNVLIVAETENDLKEQTTSGFLWLESEVDIRFYVKNYELESFGNLISFNYTKPYGFEVINVLSVEPKPEATLFTADAMDDLESSTIIGGVPRNDSGTSVASASMFKVSSIHGQIVYSNNSETLNKFCLAEAIYLKFMYIFEKIMTIKYYISQHKKTINLCYNKENLQKNEDGVQKASNVFAVKFICAHKDFPLERLFNFLCAMFSVFPDRDYCIMAIPTSTKPLRSHLEALKYFMPVAQRPSEMSNLDEVYITHRSTIFGEISLYRLEREDVETVQRLAMDLKIDFESKSISYSSSFSYSSKVNTHVHTDNEVRVIEQIMEDVLENPHSEFDVFTIRCGNSSKPAHDNTPIGFVIVRRFLYHRDLLLHYHLPKDDHHLDHERAEIITLKLHPLFNNSCDLIFRSLAGRTNYFDYYFFCGRKANIFSNDLKTLMMLVEPRPRKKNVFNTLPSIIKSPKTIVGLPSYNYFNDHLTVFRHKLNPSKFFGNSNRLVIIGFSSECRAFLRQLLFVWNSKNHKNSKTYTCLPRLQVTVIAEPGIVEAEYECTFICPECANSRSKSCFMYYENSSCYVRDVIARMDLRYWVQFITGHVNYIDREKKLVRINKACDVVYDTLMLMNSVNFNLKDTLPFDEQERRPYNFIQLNHRLDRFIMFYKVRVLLEELKRSYRIVIFGSNLSTYEFIDFLLTHGVDPTHVILVQPREVTPSEEEQKYKNPMDDTNIGYVLDDMLSDIDLTIYRDFTFSHWVQHAASNFILEVVFTDCYKNALRLDCDIFVSFRVGYMDPIVKKCLIDSDIQLRNNKILVNKKFQTNDPDIYAVGNFIQFNEPVNHQYRFTSEMETAQKLMHIMGLRESEKPYEEKYMYPAFFRATLPMDYYITKVTMPCRYLSSCVVNCMNCSLTTYYHNTFCRIGLSQKMIVDEIVVVTKRSSSLDYLEHFCGKHESMLNNLKAHHKNGDIKCFLKFLQEPWTELLMHEDFEDLQQQNRKILMPMIKNLQNLKDSPEQHLHDVNKHFLEQNLLDFVRENRKDFKHEFALPEDYVEENFG
ncbi:cilia- and flagella-associated protein 61 isoform X1 [Drosophila albomicans]|uniref:Cilia- and flagella-associated protein 61 isoform X1 n=1 Tax=Drosophila albomicans TaxID=7291 RepID=A0A6P8X8P4_DROAB|nr:cilia- and flagella-associated protein 61 isoform X1 [Drosophila albomicans]